VNPRAKIAFAVVSILWRIPLPAHKIAVADAYFKDMEPDAA
jgi:hypothetical protein